MKDLLLPEEVFKHELRDDTWDLADHEIEDKIRELRKEVYRLQHSRKKQPLLAIFRKEGFGTGEMCCHVFDGFQILDEKKQLFCADSWRRISEREAASLKERYPLTPLALQVLDKMIKVNKNEV